MRAARTWGIDGTLPFPVCKLKFQPFRRDRERLFGCHLHHAKRAARVHRCGADERWEDFAQWTPP